MLPYILSIFLSALLLFQIQPIISKTLLPWFGGSSALWSGAMLFFEILLTCGYAYANWLVRLHDRRKQTFIHLVLLGISVGLVVFLWAVWPSPVTPAESWKPGVLVHPLPTLFALLTVSVGMPFFVLSTNSPLTQTWFSRANPGRSPFWLYALSNIGSLAGLLAYPILIEPLLSIPWQGWLWAGGYVIFVILAGYNALRMVRISAAPTVAEPPAAIETSTPENEGQKSKKGALALWILLSGCASLLMLAVTNQVTQEVAVIPFLWVLPLSIYLLTFVLTFAERNWYRRKPFFLLLLIATFGLGTIMLYPATNYIVQLVIYSILLFAAAMICHGELYALRPQPAHLTRFYLVISIGGALGGVFVNLLAPLIFRGYIELYIGVALAWILLSVVTFPQKGQAAGVRFGTLVGAMADVVTILMVVFIVYSSRGNLYDQRNFYGVVHVKEKEVGDSGEKAYYLVHGSTVHGFQYIDAELRDTPTSYYSAESGIGLAIRNDPHYGAGLRVGVLGLGAGTLAAYGQPGDNYRFYEINPAVIDLANGKGGYFSFLKDSGANVEIVPGDARLSLERETAEGRNNAFDILVLDTFSSDSIPVHLVTRQAFAVYLQQLAPSGLIAAHISNKWLDLRPVLWQLAKDYGLQMAILQNPAEGNNPAATASIWVLLTRDAQRLSNTALAKYTQAPGGFRTDLRLWTDDYSNLFQILK